MQSDLHSLYPTIYNGVLETDILADVGDSQFDRWFRDMDEARLNQFILTADIRGIEQYERVYEIKPDPRTEDIEFRRQRVILKMLMRIPFTWRFLIGYLNRLDEDYSAALYHNEYLVIIKVMRYTEAQRVMLISAVRQIVPANIQLGFESTADTTIKQINIAGAVFEPVAETRLPPYIPFASFDKNIQFVVFRGSVQQTKLPKYTPSPPVRAVLSSDGGILAASLRTDNGGVQPAAIKQRSDFE